MGVIMKPKPFDAHLITSAPPHHPNKTFGDDETRSCFPIPLIYHSNALFMIAKQTTCPLFPARLPSSPVNKSVYNGPNVFSSCP